jgi:hypothetical protein
MDDVPTHAKCKTCGKDTPRDMAHDYMAYRDEEDDMQMILYCSKTCKDAEPVTCHECGKKMTRGEERFGEGNLLNWKAWCSKKCYKKKEERDRKKEFWGEIIMYTWVILPWVVAVLGSIALIYRFWPDIIAATLWLMPISGIITLVSWLIVKQSGGATTAHSMFTIPFTIPYGIVFGLSTLTFLSISVYITMAAR